MRPPASPLRFLLFALAALALGAAAHAQTYTLGTSSIVEGPAAGTDSVVLAVSTPTGAWTASTTTPWLGVATASASGAGSANVIFTFAANSGPTRSGALTIGGNTLTVTQAGSTFVAVSPTVALVSAGLYDPTGLAIDSSGNLYFADHGSGHVDVWSPGAGLSTVISAGLSQPTDVAADASGNLYISEYGVSGYGGAGSIQKYSLDSQLFTQLATTNVPSCVALDVSGNVYFPGTGGVSIQEYSPAGANITTPITLAVTNPGGVAVDAAGNVYFSDPAESTVEEYSAATGTVAPVGAQGLNGPTGVAVDAAGNVYIADTNNGAIKEWVAATGQTVTLAIGLSEPTGVAVDAAGSVYFSSGQYPSNSAVYEIPRAFVDTAPATVALTAGSASIAVLPATLSLQPPFMPQSNQSWLAITASGNGAANYSFSADTSAPRYAEVTILGQQIVVDQGVFSPLAISGPTATGVGGGVATLGGTITSDGGAPLISAGVVYAVTSINPNPQIGGEGVTTINQAANGAGAFTETITNLSASTEYSYAAFVIGSTGTAYTPASTFTTPAPTLTLAASSVTEGPAAGTDSVLLAIVPSANIAWTATANVSWLHLSAANQSGSGSATVVFTFDPNTGAPRTGTITIAGNTFTVTQAGAGFVRADPFPLQVANELLQPSAVAVDASGNVYIADTFDNAIKEYSPATQTLTTLVALSSELSNPRAVAVDGSGNVYFTDASIPAVKEYVAATQQVVTIASAGLSNPESLALDNEGNLLIADSANDAIFLCSPGSSGLVTFLNAGLTNPVSVATDAAGNVYVGQSGRNVPAVLQYSAATQSLTTLLASGVDYPFGMATDGSGNLYITDSQRGILYEYSPIAGLTTLATSGPNPARGVAVDGSGNVYFTSGNSLFEILRVFVNTNVVEEALTAGSATITAFLPTTEDLSGLFAPTSDQSWLTIGTVSGGGVEISLTADPNPADPRHAEITILDQQIVIDQGVFPPLAIASPTATAITQGSAALGANVTSDGGIPIVARGVVYAPTSVNANPQIGGPGVMMLNDPARTAGAFTETITGLADATSYSYAGFVYTTQDEVYTTPVSTFTTLPPSFNLATSTFTEGPAAGTDSVLLAVTPSAASWTAAPNASWLHLSTANQSGTGSAIVIFNFDANTGATRSGTLTIAGQTLAVTQAGSSYVTANPFTAVIPFGDFQPVQVAVDGNGNLYFADAQNGNISEWVAADGMIKVLVPSVANPAGVAVDSLGNVYFTDSSIPALEEYIAATQEVVTLAGSNSELSNPVAVAVDTAGNVYIADAGSDSIEKYSPQTQTLAPLVQGLDVPNGVAVDGIGNVYITDTYNNAIEEYSPSTGGVTTLATAGQAMPICVTVDASGNVYFVAFDGGIVIDVYSPVTGKVTILASPRLDSPQGIAVDGAGNLYIGDNGAQAIYEQPRAFVDAAPRNEPLTSGSDTLAPVLPVSTNLQGAFTPSSNQSWLTFGNLTFGSVSGGVVTYFFSADSGAPRYGQITLLGQEILVNQGVFPLPRITTPTAGSITPGGAVLGGDVTTDSGDPISALGVVYAPTSVNPIPTLAGTDVTVAYGASNSTGVFAINVSGLQPNTTYSYAAFVTTAGGGTAYTRPVGTFTTLPPIFTLATAALAEGNAAGSDSVVLTIDPPSGAPWTAATATPWLHVATASGILSGNVVFSFDANSGATRSGTVTIGGKALTVVQAGSTYVAAGALTHLVSSLSVLGPSGVAVDAAGNVYIADSDVSAILEYVAATQSLTTLVSAGLKLPQGVAVDTVGNVYISDTGNDAIKEYSPATQTVTTLASGLSTAPYGLAVDGAGNIYIAEPFANAIAVYAPATQTVTTLISSGLSSPYGVALDRSDNLFIADTGDGVVDIYSLKTGSGATITGYVGSPKGVAVDANDDVYIADADDNAIKVLSSTTKTVTTLVSSGLGYPNGVAVDNAGRVYISDFSNNAVVEYEPASPSLLTLAPSPSLLDQPQGVAVDASGNVYIADTENNAVKEWKAVSRTVVTLVSSGLNQPVGVAVDPAGNVYIADSGNNDLVFYNVHTESSAPIVSTGLSAPLGVAVDASGNVYIADSGHNAIELFSPATGNLTPFISSGLNQPTSVAVDAAGNVYITDSGNGAIKEYNVLAQSISTLIPGLSNPAGVAVDPSGNVYTAETVGGASILKYSAATQSVYTLVSSGLASPNGVAVDASGNLYIADPGANAIDEVPRAFVDPTAKQEPAAPGADSLPMVLPPNAPLFPPFVSSNQAWLSFSAGQNGMLDLSFTANAAAASRSATLTLLGQPISVTQSPSTLPLAVNDVAFLNGAAPITINVLANDLSPQGYTLSVQSITQPSRGKAVLVRNAVTYTPKTSFAAFPGTDSFTYTISDGHGGMATATVTIRNPYQTIGGNYDGLVTYNAGALNGAPNGNLTLSLTTSGSFTGSLKLAGYSYSFTGAFASNGIAAVTITRPGQASITLTLSVDEATGSQLTASFTADGASYTAKTGPREQYNATTNKAPEAGIYTAILPAPTAPIGAAATATATVTDGKITGVTVTYEGFGYVTVPRVVVSGAHGSGAAGVAAINAYGNVTSITIKSKGAHYPANTTVTIDPPTAGLPEGTGWATMTVAASGAVTIAGKLGDGAAFSLGAFVHHGNISDSFNLYAPLYATVSKPAAPGSIIGAITFEASQNSDCDGALAWVKPAQSSGALYVTGFDTSVTFIGATYTAPHHSPLFPVTQSLSFDLAGGILNSPVSIPLSITSANAIKVFGDNPFHLSLPINAAAGTFSGTVQLGRGSAVSAISGVIYQSPSGVRAQGLFLGGSQTGAVSLTP